MGKGITLSKNHDINPSIMVCPICGKEESIALLGHIKGDKEAPRYIQGDICDECKARVADNKCFVVSVDENGMFKNCIIVNKDIFTINIKEPMVFMKEAEFNVVFNKN